MKMLYCFWRDWLCWMLSSPPLIPAIPSWEGEGEWNLVQNLSNWLVALQVIQHMATEAEKQARDEQLEAILGLKMMHPNIVRTFQFATKDRSVRLLPHSCLAQA